MDIQKKWESINRMGQEWYDTPPEGNEAYRHSLWCKIFIALDQCYKSDIQKEALMDIMCEEWKYFNPSIGTVSQFLGNRLKNRVIDIKRADITTAPAKVIDDKTGQSKTIRGYVKSIDEPDDDGLSTDIPDPLAVNAEALAVFNARLVELGAMVLNLKLAKSSDTENRRMWYRLFYTEDVTLAAKTDELSVIHERDIFSAMKLPYLDYYMRKKCRTLRQITYTPLKAYGEIVPQKKEIREEPKLPFTADISLSYLNICENISRSHDTHSRQKQNYAADKGRLSQC